MSWAKLASKSFSTVPPDTENAQSGTNSPATARRESNAAGGGSNAMKGLMKRLSSVKSSGNESPSGSEGGWKAMKRMSLAGDKNADRSSANRMSDGSLGAGIADLAKNMLLQTQGQEMSDTKGMRKMSSAFRKLGKAQMMLA